MEEEEKGISISEIFKVIFKRVWWVVGVTAAVLIVFTCIMQFLYNPSNQKYTTSYDIRLPSFKTNTDGTVIEEYPDGTQLKVSDSVLLENLQLIKNESLLPEDKRTGKFADIDIVKMVNDDDIELIRAIEKKEDETYEYHNTVRIVKKYFKNKEQALAFVKAVAEFPVDNAIKIVNSMNYSERLARFDRYMTYEEKINALVEQKNYIINTYEGIKQLYGGEYVPAGLNSEKDIDEYIRDLTDVFDARQQEAVRNTVSAKYYVWDTATYLENAQAKIDSLTVEIQDNENTIAALQEARKHLLMTGGGIVATEAYEVRIAELTEENSKKNNEKLKTERTLDAISAYTDGEGKAAKDAFDARLNEIRNQLEQSTQILRTVNIATYEEKAQVVYVNNKVEVEGGLNIIIAAVIGALIGFVIVSIVILIIDFPKYKRQKLAEQAGEKEISEEADGKEKE